MNISDVTAIMKVLNEGVYFVDTERTITFWNNAAVDITGYAAEQVLGKKCSDNLLRHVDGAGHELCTNGCPLQKTILDGNIYELEAYLHHKDGHRVPVFIRSAPLKDSDGKITGSVEIFTDRSDRKKLLHELEQLRREVLTDPLTGLGNRRYLEIIAESAIKRLNESQVGFGILMIDIDHFKRVNDTYGHLVGDKVLVMVAKCLLGATRPLDTVVRFGGEEFLIFCPNVTPHELAILAERLRVVIASAWIDLPEGIKVSITVSLGGTIATINTSLEDLIEIADKALYHCKNSGRNKLLIQ